MISEAAKVKIREMLAEDLGFADLTSEAVLPQRLLVKAEIIAGQQGILAGVEEAAFAFGERGVRVEEVKKDGESIKAGETVMRLEGDPRGIFAAERVALNLLMRMSGVATATRGMVERARKANPKTIVAATRKTIPGFSYFDKRAVAVGGGDPHRFRLDDCVLIKSHHVSLVGSIERAIERALKASFTKKVEIEVTNAGDALRAARAGADIVMLDNVSPEEVKRAIELLKKAGLRDRVLVEASGGIDQTNVMSYAIAGADVVSSSYMTFQAPALDMKLKVRGKDFKPRMRRRGRESR